MGNLYITHDRAECRYSATERRKTEDRGIPKNHGMTSFAANPATSRPLRTKETSSSRLRIWGRVSPSAHRIGVVAKPSSNELTGFPPRSVPQSNP